MDEYFLIGPKEMAKILGVPVSWIYQRTRKGQTAIPHYKMGKYVKFAPEAVLDFFKNKEN